MIFFFFFNKNRPLLSLYFTSPQECCNSLPNSKNGLHDEQEMYFKNSNINQGSSFSE